MHNFRHLIPTLLCAAALLGIGAYAQSNLTQIRDTIYNSDGSPFNGTVVITWNGSSGIPTGTVSPLSTSARIYNGALSVLLVPTTTAGANSYYQVVYTSSNGTTQWTETWQVPPSTNALSVSGVRTSTAPGGGPGTGGGSGTGATQYATLPIAQSQVTGLSTALTTLTTSTTANTSDISALKTSVANLTSTVASLPTAANYNVAFVDGETPGGTANGTNTAFTLAGTPNPVSSLELYRNGLVQKPGIDYTLNGSSVTFTSVSIPKTGDILQAYYRTAGSTASVSFTDAETPVGTIDGTNAAFTLGAAPAPIKSLKLYKNGQLLQVGSDFTLFGSTVTFATPVIPQSGDSITAYYRH